AALSSGGADADDAPALAGFTHVGRGGAHACEGAAQVHVDDGVEVVVAHLPQHGVAQHAGIGDEDVEAAEGAHRGLDELGGRLGRPDGGDDGGGTAACGLDRGDSVGGGLRIDVVHDDRGALACELLRVGEPESATGPGDDGDLAL